MGKKNQNTWTLYLLHRHSSWILIMTGWETTVVPMIAILFVYLFVCSLQGVWDRPHRIRALLSIDKCVFRHFPCADPHSTQVITLSPFNLFAVSVWEVMGTKHTQPCLEVSYWLAAKLLQFIFLLHLIELLSDAIQVAICLRVSKQIPRCSALCLYNFPPTPQPLFSSEDVRKQ